MKQTTEKTKNELLKEYFCAVVEDDILTIDKLGRLKINGVVLTPGEQNGLLEEAKFLYDSRLWKILINTPKARAMEIMFTKSENFEDMRNGKMMLYNLSLQENLVKTILNFAKKI